MHESKIINLLYKTIKKESSDCYYLNQNRLVTTDSLAEGTHFLLAWSSPEQIAEKLVEVNVSDIAAGGGYPTHAFLNLGLNEFTSETNWITRFVKKFRKCLDKYSIQISGGDTYFSKTTNLTLSLLGNTIRKTSREKGRLGDYLYLSGYTGYSLLGYQILSKRKDQIPKSIKQKAILTHLAPSSEFFLAKKLVRDKSIHAMMDVTDGLLQDLEKLSSSSGLGFEVYLDEFWDKHPLKKIISLDESLSSGEELKLLILSKKKLPKSYNLIQLGIATNVTGVKYYQLGKKLKFSKKGYLHFKNNS
ncbi:MAG: thiamine-phosphate kinase [Leptospiraceae bacterium]|nr:thiamine-phosphate kinase [Leptospiraceae bacterium]